MVDATSGETIMSKNHKVAYELLEELESNNYQWPQERARLKSTARVVKLDSIASLATQMATPIYTTR